MSLKVCDVDVPKHFLGLHAFIASARFVRPWGFPRDVVVGSFCLFVCCSMCM